MAAKVEGLHSGPYHRGQEAVGGLNATRKLPWQICQIMKDRSISPKFEKRSSRWSNVDRSARCTPQFIWVFLGFKVPLAFKALRAKLFIGL